MDNLFYHLSTYSIDMANIESSYRCDFCGKVENYLENLDLLLLLDLRNETKSIKSQPK